MPNSRPPRQARYWIATVPRTDWNPELPTGAVWCVGQPEVGEETGYRHWQFIVAFSSKKSLTAVKRVLPHSGHYEPTRSEAAEAYVRKEETRDGEPFEFGRKPFNRNSKTDWNEIKQLAQQGEIDNVPADVYIRYYRTLKVIGADYAKPSAIEKTVYVFHGPTGSGKSRRAWEEAGADAYAKDPRTKFWCGYRGQQNVILDEFRGGIDIAHMLRWLDRYPVRVETKGASTPLCAERVWITSNLHPDAWYPELDEATRAALLRRLEVILIE